MSIIRTYFDKNNTIINGIQKEYNTGRNPVTEIFYGERISRFLFYIDFNDLQAKITDKVLDISTITKHTLKMKNTMNYDVLPFRDFRNQIEFSDDRHAYSFDLELIAINEDWDEGIGYDFDNAEYCNDDRMYLKGTSNWIYRQGTTAWTTEGAVSSGATTIVTQHFDTGNEDIEMDVTNFINSILTGATYSGLCVKYTSEFETVSGTTDTLLVGFFTRHTNTFFEPFIETEYDDLITDDRRNFILDQTNHLALYVREKGNLFNLDELPTCTINSTHFTVTQKTKGVYSAEVLLPSSGFTDLTTYHDIWSNIIINNVTQPNITLDIVPQLSPYRYSIGENHNEPIRYGVSVSGIKRDEKLKQGELKKVTINARKPYTVYDVDVIDNIYYKLYIKQGINQIVVVDWTEVNRAYDTNYFSIDTSWLVPQQYFADIKIVSGDEVSIHNEELRFTIISQM